MYIKYLDYLSPRTTLYYKGFLSHSSITSGLISIISIIFVILLAVQFSLEAVKRDQPNAFYYNSFTDDAGIININNSSLFHFINIVQNITGIINNEAFDFTRFNIFGVDHYIDNFLVREREIGIINIDHWLYGYCDKDINTDGLDELLSYDFFEKSACIKKYYNSTERIYYNIGDSKFIWPSISHGTLNAKNKIYGLYIQKCNNKTIKNILGDEYQCKRDSEIDNYFQILGSRIIYLNFINNFINVLNYENPNEKFVYRIENPFIKDFYSSNALNFNPAILRSHNGLVFDFIKSDYSYIFDRNDVYTSSNEGKNIYIGYTFFLKNMVAYYERSYKKIQELFSNIGGIYQIINILSFFINYLYYKFIVLFDTEILLYSSVKIEKEIHKKKSNELKTKIKDLPKKKNKKSTENSKITQHKILNKEKKEGKINTNIYNKNESDKSNMNLFNEIEKKKKDKNNVNRKDTSNYYIDLNNKEKIKANIKNKNFLNFVFYEISCKHKKKSFKVYEKFRKKILSEEHLVRNHLNIYNLLKVTEKKRSSKRYSYQLKDLINIV